MPSDFLPAEEEQVRVAQLAAGPWHQAGAAAFGLLPSRPAPPPAAAWLGPLGRPVTAGSRPGAAAGPVPLAESLLRGWLRPHWEAAVAEPAQLAFRNSLDDALTDLQLQELALENGYVTLAAVQPNLLYRLQGLLHSPAVRQYLLDYGYVNVWRLARRVGVGAELLAQPLALRELTARLPAPRVDAAGAVRFASFLSQYRQWRENPNLGLFLKLSDDYGSGSAAGLVGREAVAAFLRQDPAAALAAMAEEAATGRLPVEGNAAPAPEQVLLLRAACGLVDFVRALANLEQVFAGADQSGLAAFFGYWLAKYFGYSLRGTTAVRNATDWSREAVPATLLLGMTTGLPPDQQEAAPAQHLRQLADQHRERGAAVASLWQVAQQTLGLTLLN